MNSLKSIEVSPWSARQFKSYAELVEGLRKPNATCPDCHRPVFYFASKKGHGEYFNGMGPGWARHPCADGGRLKRIIQRLEADHKKAGPGIVAPGYPEWLPFWVQSISNAPLHPTSQTLTGHTAHGPLTLMVVDGRLDINAPYYVWKDEPQWYVQTLIGTDKWLVDRVFMAQEVESVEGKSSRRLTTGVRPGP